MRNCVYLYRLYAYIMHSETEYGTHS